MCFVILADMEHVILVDAMDNELGTMEKLEAHEKGVLHRAFSVFIFNARGEMLLQQRALQKYHSPGLWTNACCSHPRPSELTANAAQRRLQEEMGLSTPLQHKTSFVYRSEFENGLTEHEFDHIYIGQTNEEPKLNYEEVASFRWIEMAALKEEIKKEPESFTTWFRIAIQKFF
jgi:isopentenyl-diphosphate delta-isomerase